jgi:O-antigen ligase
LAVASVIVVGGVLLQRAGSFAVVGAPYLSDRYDSFFGYYTVAAGFLALVLPLCWVLLATSVGHRADWIAGAVGFGACGLGLVLLQSRGGLAAGGAALCVAIALSPGGKRQVFLVAALCVSLFAVVWLFTDQSSRSYVLDRLTDSGDINAGSDSQRADLQRVGAQLASERPLGIGYGQFSSNVNSSVTRVLFHSHSVYSQVPLDIGWLGASALAVLVIVPIWKAVVARIRRRQTYLLAGCAGALVGALVQGANDYLFYEAAWWMGLALVLGLAVAALPATDEIPAVIERART